VEIVPLYVNNMEPWQLEGMSLAPNHCTPQPLTGPFARAMLAELQDFSSALPGGSPTRVRVEGDLGIVEASPTRIAVADPRRVEPTSPPIKVKAKAKKKRR